MNFPLNSILLANWIQEKGMKRNKTVIWSQRCVTPNWLWRNMQNFIADWEKRGREEEKVEDVTEELTQGKEAENKQKKRKRKKRQWQRGATDRRCKNRLSFLLHLPRTHSIVPKKSCWKFRQTVTQSFFAAALKSSCVLWPWRAVCLNYLVSISAVRGPYLTGSLRKLNWMFFQPCLPKRSPPSRPVKLKAFSLGSSSSWWFKPNQGPLGRLSDKGEKRKKNIYKSFMSAFHFLTFSSFVYFFLLRLIILVMSQDLQFKDELLFKLGSQIQFLINSSIHQSFIFFHRLSNL